MGVASPNVTGTKNIGLAGANVDGTRHRLEGNAVDDSEGNAYQVDGSRHVLVDNIGRANQTGFQVLGSDQSLVENIARFGGDGVGNNDGRGFPSCVQ